MLRKQIPFLTKIAVLALALAAGAPAIAAANAPGGDYIQCDPHNPSSPVRCRTDSW